MKIFIFMLCATIVARSARVKPTGKYSGTINTATEDSSDFTRLLPVNMESVTLLTTGNLRNDDFVKLISIADDPVGVTGDQSMIESVLLGKIPYYETMEWKHRFADDVEQTARQQVDGGGVLESFLKKCTKEPRRQMRPSNTTRYVTQTHFDDVSKHVDEYLENWDRLRTAVNGLSEYIKTQKNFKDWLEAVFRQWLESSPKKEGMPLRVLLFTENIAGFGNAYNIERVGDIIKDFTAKEGFPKIEIQTVVTTIGMEPGSIATPDALHEKFPGWVVPRGDSKAQLATLFSTIKTFNPDLVMASPVTSFHPREIARLKLEFRSIAKAVLWLGEYASGYQWQNGTRVHGLGIGEANAGVLVPDLETKLVTPFHSRAAATLHSVAKHLKANHLFLFGYFHSEAAVRDYLLFARILAQRTQKHAIVVMPRMKCVDEGEKDFRNMQAMLSSLIGPESSFGNTLKVYYMGKPEDEVMQWDAWEGRCIAVTKNSLQGPQSVVSSVHGLLDIFDGASGLKTDLEDSSIIEISEAAAHGLRE